MPQQTSHCSPLQTTLTCNFFSQRGNRSKIFPLQRIADHSYMAILVRGVFPQKLPVAAHCSPLQPTLKWQF